MANTRSNNNNNTGNHNPDPEARIRELEALLAERNAMDNRILTLLENQARVQDDNGKYFKRMVDHRPPYYDGMPDPVRFEDW